MLCHATAATLALDLCTEDVSIGCNVVVQVCVLSQQLGTSTYAFSEPRTQLIRTMVSGHIRRVLSFSSMMKRSLHFRIQCSNRRGIIRPIQYSYQVYTKKNHGTTGLAGSIRTTAVHADAASILLLVVFRVAYCEMQQQ